MLLDTPRMTEPVRDFVPVRGRAYERDEMIDAKLIATLRAVIDAGSFSRAAQRLRYTPSAVSHQISQLERQTGLVLFDRTPRSIVTRPEAHFILTRSERLLSELQSLASEVEDYRQGYTRRLRIGCFPTASERVIPAVVQEVKNRFPDVLVTLEEGGSDMLAEMIESEDLDAAFLSTYSMLHPVWKDSIRAERLYSDELMVIRSSGSRDFSIRDRGDTLVEFRESVWITSHRTNSFGVALSHLCRRAGYEPRVLFRSANYLVIEEIVKRAIGISMVPASVIRRVPGVEAVRVADINDSRETFVAFSPSLPDVFRDCIRKASMNALEMRLTGSL